MRLLASVVAGDLTADLKLEANPRHFLIEACLELMWFTAEIGKTLPNATQWLDEVAGSPVLHPMLLQRRPADATPGMQRMASSPNRRLWMFAIENAFRHFDDAIRASSLRVSAARAISEIRDKVWQLVCLSVWAGQSEKTSGSVMATVADQMLPDAYHDYLELGITAPMLLAYAMAREFTRRADVPSGPDGISRIAEEACRLWDLADHVAAEARKSTTLASTLIAAHECHLHYTLAEILLGWAIDRHRATDGVPSEWRKERQILEELRVAMHDTLGSLGNHFAGEPCLIAYFKCMPSTAVPEQGIRIELRQIMEQTVADAVVRNPLFPNVLAPVMADCCLDIPDMVTVHPSLQDDADSILAQVAERLNDPLDRFRNCVATRYRESFSDADVVACAQKISGRWNDSSEAAELVAQGDKLVAASAKNNRQLLNKLKDNPFIVIRRECKHSLRVAKDVAEGVLIGEQLRGTPAPRVAPTCKPLILLLSERMRRFLLKQNRATQTRTYFIGLDHPGYVEAFLFGRIQGFVDW